MMKKTWVRRTAVVALCFLLVMLFTIPAFAEGAVDDAVSGIGDKAGEIIGNLENENPEIAEIAKSVLAIDSLDEANAFLAGYDMTILLIIAAVGLVLAMLGYKLLKLAITLGGFAAGWMLGTMGYTFVLNLGLIADIEAIPGYVPYIVYAVVGIICAALANKIVKLGIFFASAAGTYFFLNGFDFLNTLVDKVVATDFDAKYLIARVLVAVIVGILALLITKPIVMLTTAGAGGMVCGISFMVAIGQTANTQTEMIVGAVIAVLGVLVQFNLDKGKKKK